MLTWNKICAFVDCRLYFKLVKEEKKTEKEKNADFKRKIGKMLLDFYILELIPAALIYPKGPVTHCRRCQAEKK